MQQRVIIAKREYALRFRLDVECADVEREASRRLQAYGSRGPVRIVDTLTNVREIEATLVWGAIKAGVTDKKLTVEDVLSLIQAHIEDGGDYNKLMSTVRRAAFESGVMGNVPPAVIDSLCPREENEVADAVVPH